LASNDAVVDALFEHAGVIRANTLEEFFDVATLLTHVTRYAESRNQPAEALPHDHWAAARSRYLCVRPNFSMR
jgi:acyl-CoA synthetase (NDP forming)